MNESEKTTILTTVESLQTESDILEKSSLIYISPKTQKQVDLESIIRFGNLPTPMLEKEYDKVCHLTDYICNTDEVIEESTIKYVDDMKRLIECKLQKSRVDDIYGDIDNFMLEMTEYAHVMPDSYNTVTESLELSKDSAFDELLEGLSYLSIITPKGVVVACETAFMNRELSDDDYEEFKELIIRKMRDTFKNETEDYTCHDLPIVANIPRCKSKLVDDFGDRRDIVAKIDEIFDDFMDSIEDELEEFKDKILKDINAVDEDDTCYEEFNCNPYASVYNMAPFPVGCRTVGTAIEECFSAESDEALTEALIKLSRLMTVCESVGLDVLMERPDTAVAKAARSNKKFSDKALQKVKNTVKGARDAKVAIDKNKDGFVKFIEQTYDSIVQKDRDDRKKEIMSKGLKGKLKMILRWVKRVGIPVVAGAVVGPVVPVAAVVAAIYVIGYIVKDSVLDSSARDEVLRELNDEIKVCEEKIEDSRGDDNKQNKYELIRIKSALEKERDRIKTHREY